MRRSLPYSKRRSNHVLQHSGRLTHVLCQVKSLPTLLCRLPGPPCMRKHRFLISNGERAGRWKGGKAPAKQGDELARIDHAIKFRRRERNHRRTESTATQEGDGHGKPRFARMYGRTEEAGQSASQPTMQPAGSHGSDLHAV